MLKIEELLGKNISEYNSQYLNDLKKRVQENKTSWILGAGISKSIGLPLWGECLLSMWGRILLLEKVNNDSNAYHRTLIDLKKEICGNSTFLEKVNEIVNGSQTTQILNGVNTLEAAEYIKNFVKETIPKKNDTTTDFIQESFQMGYFSLIKDSFQLNKSADEIYSKMKGQVIDILATYFTKLANDKKKVTVITYNFDDLLEFALEKSGLNAFDCHVKNPGTSKVLEAETGVHIYHPHGTLSVVPNSFSEESYKLVLAESDYEDLESKSYIWQNSIQAKSLHNSSCVFIGFSGEDYNFRRILKNMENGDACQNNKHYMFISIESFVKRLFKTQIEKQLLGDIPRTEKEREEFLNNISKADFDGALKTILSSQDMIYERTLMIKRLYAQYLYWKNRNIIPIWVTRDELPIMLNQLLE